MTLNAEQRAAIESQRGGRADTRRPTVPDLERILFEAVPLLDHGFIRVVDYMGDDAAIVQAARVSYGAGTRAVRDDAALIRYLMRHRHTTPFEMCEIKYHVKLPIFVARQWIRHRTASVNEMSGRYSVLDDEVYLPTPEVLAAQSRTNRQGRGDRLGSEEAAHVLALLRQDAAQCRAHYEDMLNDDGRDPQRIGLARELARINLTLNTYTQWYWKVDLHNLMHFLSLRAAPGAQYEIRVYAEAMLETMKLWVPVTYEAFVDYRLTAAHLSGSALAVVRRMLAGEAVTEQSSGLGKGDWRELMAILGRDG